MTPPGVLASYRGSRPASPRWFKRALSQRPARSVFDVAGVPIELLTWGEPGRPGLLFLHGDSAHADWWSFIAPFFMADWRVAAISWSGMGRSGHRDRYTLDLWADEALSAIDAAGLDDGRGTILVAHSLGGYPALIAAGRTERIRGLISIESAIIPQEMRSIAPRPFPRPHRIYASREEALARFRFMPPTIGDRHYVVDHLARSGLETTESGWRWRFDPEIWRDIDKRGDLSALPATIACPQAVIVGDASELIDAEVARFMRGLYPAGTPFITIPEAGHHVMVDQPIALIATIRACLAWWGQESIPD